MFRTEARIRAEYYDKAMRLITSKIANMKTDGEYFNLLPILEFAEKLGVITQDDGLRYYQVATNKQKLIQKAREAEKERLKAERAAKAKAAKNKGRITK